MSADGIFHFRKYLLKGNISEYFFEILFAYVVAYNNVFFTADNFGMSSGGRAVSLIV